MSAADAAVTAAEARTLFRPFARHRALLLAVSGGPDSTALLFLAARWRRGSRTGPRLVAATVDHGLRHVSAAEAMAVARLARKLGVAHHTLTWQGAKPTSGLQAAARAARYALLAAVASDAGASHVLTAHTLDDQAETVLLRLCRGSGLAGLAAMSDVAPLPVRAAGEIVLARPLLDVPKARLVATLARAGIAFADDPSNRDPRFTRARLREAMPALAHEGLDAARLATLARRVRRAEMAIEAAVDAATASAQWATTAVVLDAEHCAALPAEVSLRLLARAVARVAPTARVDGQSEEAEDAAVPLGKLEALHQALQEADFGRSAKGMRRTLKGVLVTARGQRIVLEAAPPRKSRSSKP
ncbi:MAG: tRNA lysidine(34) synthetase TilS [Hyphomicrobiales bacterium]|nr:tRNA lysidine(34) synthetase TilS [Hyphomicrobiales bacterium]